jgi:hypothetical protein
MTKQEILKQFCTIPGVGKAVSQDLFELGFRSLEDLKGKDPEKIYQDHMKIKGGYVDRCMLYTFRCAVYFVSNSKHDHEKLKWWNWKD